jgi:subtilisin family serine protease
LQAALERAAPGETVTAWVYFRDKGVDVGAAMAAADANLTRHARKRRLRHGMGGNLATPHDIPVSPAYIAAVRDRVTRVRHASRWLGAVSVEVEAGQVNKLNALPFVRYLDVVHSSEAPRPMPVSDAPEVAPPPQAATSMLNYGNSFTQNNQINTIPLHDLGLTGNGVLIAMLDTGFNLIDEHNAFGQIDIMITHDFVNGDSIVWDQPAQMGSGNHGTYTLSAIGGFAPGEVIGPAWGATYVLARTENTVGENHIEEDNWIAGAEWADSLGADIISSSLGYRNLFDDGGDYSWGDFDGDTTPTTIAADIAASLGILVVNSAGNMGWIGEPFNSLIAPSDGDSVLCIGAVDGSGVRASFSSVGLSADGRIKPDVMAMGVLVRAANPVTSSGYVNVGGTSLSCPLAAGAAALLLEGNPSLTNMEIINALRSTASQSGSPDRLMGYGIIDAAAAFSITVSAIGDGGRTPARGEVILHPAYPNPFNPSTTIRYELPEAAIVSLTIHDVRGRLVATLESGPQSPGLKTAIWNGSTRTGTRASSGMYFYRLIAGDVERTRKMVLLK